MRARVLYFHSASAKVKYDPKGEMLRLMVFTDTGSWHPEVGSLEDDDEIFVDGTEGDYVPGINDLLDPEDDPDDGPNGGLPVADGTYVDVETWLAGRDVDDLDDLDEDDFEAGVSLFESEMGR